MGAYKDSIWASDIQDPYCYERSVVLRNRLNERDDKKLTKLEADLSANRIAELHEKPIQGNFDFPHLMEIHRRIFQDIYDWAGKARTVDISKGSSRFATHGMLEGFLGRLSER